MELERRSNRPLREPRREAMRLCDAASRAGQRHARQNSGDHCRRLPSRENILEAAKGKLKKSFAGLLEGGESFTRLRCKSPAIAAFWRGDCARVPVLEGLQGPNMGFRGLKSHKKCNFKELDKSSKLAQKYRCFVFCPGVLKLGSGSRAGDAMVSSFTPEASRPVHWARRSWFQWNVRFADVGRKYMRRLVRLR